MATTQFFPSKQTGCPQTTLKAQLRRLGITPVDSPVEQQRQIAFSEIERLDDLWRHSIGEELRREAQRLAVDITEVKKVEQIREVMVNWLEERRNELAATAEGAVEKKTEIMEDREDKDVATGVKDGGDQRKQGGQPEEEEPRKGNPPKEEQRGNTRKRRIWDMRKWWRNRRVSKPWGETGWIN